MPNACLSCKARGDAGYYHMPRLPEARKLWLDSLGLSDYYQVNVGPNRVSWRICYRHFKYTDFKTTGKHITLLKGKTNIS